MLKRGLFIVRTRREHKEAVLRATHIDLHFLERKI